VDRQSQCRRVIAERAARERGNPVLIL